MANECIPTGWVDGSWGYAPWGGSSGAIPGGNIPTLAPFDVYCVGSCAPMTVFDTYTEVTEVASTGQLSVVYPEEDFRIESGGTTAADTNAIIHVAHSVPDTYTHEVTFKLGALPPDFSDLLHKHICICIGSSNGDSVGLFLSQAGIGYTGAIKHNASNELVLLSSFGALPDSYGLLTTGVYTTIRIVSDKQTHATYVYVTPTELVPSIGHQLRFVLPGYQPSAHSEVPINRTTISVRGTISNMSQVDLDSICFGSGMLIPNVQPIAVAGRDQNVSTCAIIQLDGSGSYDPEGATLLYQWKMTDAPDTSEFTLLGDDGFTLTPTPFTNKLYTIEGVSPNIQPGDILLFGGKTYDVLGTGTDGNGFFIQSTAYDLPANTSSISFRVIHQNGVSKPTEVRAQFIPDVQGIYKFSLTVFDGNLYSLPSETVANVIESLVPRGCIPDVSFIWNYLSDFWRLVDNREQVTTFWQGAAQIMATELLTLWQHDYGKSLRDIPRAFQRRWLHYDTIVKEQYPTQSTVEVLYISVQSQPVGVTTNWSGQTILVSFLAEEHEIWLQDNGLSPMELAMQLQNKLQQLNEDFAVTWRQNNTDPTDHRLFVAAPFFFSFVSGTCTLFTYPSNNTDISGTGTAVGVSTFRLDRSLVGTPVKDGDMLTVGDRAYRIRGIATHPSDPYSHMRLTIYGDIESTTQIWTIGRYVRSSFIDFENAMVSPGDIAFFLVSRKDSTETVTIPASVTGALTYGGKSYLTVAPGTIATFLDLNYDVHLDAIFRRKRIPVDALLLEVPTLQEQIHNKDDTAVLRQNVDFFLETYRGRKCIRFVSEDNGPDIWEGNLPPQRLWAEVTYIDNNPTIEANFGVAVEFTIENREALPSNVDYLSAVRGLWFTHFNGPTLRNLRIGTQILVGLPFAEEAGTIVEIRNDFSPTQGRILVRDNGIHGIVRSYTYPNSLGLEINPVTSKAYTEGDSVEQFAPMVSGVDIIDYIKDPKWFVPYIQQGAFTEVEKLFRFLVRVQSPAFSLSTVLFVQNFIKRVKPTYTFPMFVVSQAAKDATVDVSDQIDYGVMLNLETVPCSSLVGSLRHDDIRGDGTTWNNYDSGVPKDAPLLYPDSHPTHWAFDRENLCPSDYIEGEMCSVIAAPTLMTFDSVFSFDTPVYTDTFMDAGTPPLYLFYPAGTRLYPPHTSTGAFTIDSLFFNMDSELNPGTQQLLFIIKKNGITEASIPFTTYAGIHYETMLPVAPSINVVAGDVIELFIATQSATPQPAAWSTCLARLGAAYYWSFDTLVPAGTYCAKRLM